MREILTNLPAVGAFRVHLHKESEALVNYFGDEELARLGRIDHLGAATVAFTGINHKRLEYVLLQCAITQLVAKLYKDNPDLALSNSVELSGASKEISSGEELLKCWVILSNVGHPNWTYNTERAMLNGALENDDLRDWLLSGAVEQDLSEWANEVIAQYNDRQSRYLLTLLRLREKRPKDPRKHFFRQMIRNRILIPSSLSFTNSAARDKLVRLRLMSHHIQLLAMVTLDTYHSHSPVRLELMPAIQELAESAMHTRRLRRFLDVLESTAGWVADEVYLHPRAVASQRSYEIFGTRKVLTRFRKQSGTPIKRRQLLESIMADGLGRPKSSDLKPLVRLTFPRFSSRLLEGRHRHARVIRLNNEVAVKPNSLVCIDENSFSRSTHVDVLYRPRNITGQQVGQTYYRLITWLIRAIEAFALERVRRMLPTHTRDHERVEASRRRTLKFQMNRSRQHLRVIIPTLIETLIPDGWTATVEEASEHSDDSTLAWKLTDSHGEQFDEITSHIDDLILKLDTLGDKVRSHEVKALKRIANSASGKLVIVLLQPLVIRDPFGRKKDEWDGTMLEIGAQSVYLSVVEAKSGAKKRQRSEIAFSQLAETRKIIKSRYQFNSRRTRLPGLGAYLKVEIWK